MSYISPSTTIYLYSGMPIDRRYENTLYFATKSAQTAWFLSASNPYLVETLTPNTYQRSERGRIKVQSSDGETLRTCNYLAFRNTAFSTEVFYCFIDSVDYINNEVYEITYTIDSLQTYIFDCELLPSFVERCHSETDVAGDNLVPEPIQPKTDVASSDDNYYIVPRHGETNRFFSGKFALVVFMLPSFSSASGIDMYSLNQCEMTACTVYVQDDIFSDAVDSQNLTALDRFKNFIYNHQADAQSIMCMYVVPQEIIVSNSNPPFTADIACRHDFHQVTRPTVNGGVTPRNKKLLTYPYEYLKVSTGETELDLRYEYFGTSAGVELGFYAQLSANPQMLISPVGYNGRQWISGDYPDVNIDFEHTVTFARFPMVAFPVDTYMAWLAQTASSNVLRTIGNLAIAGLIKGMPGTALLGYGLTKAVDLLATGIEKQQEADKSVGNNTGYLLNELGSCGFKITPHFMKGEEVNRFDDFFDLYGYAQNRIMTPDLNVRPHWTYIKTAGLQVKANCPNDDAESIVKIFDNGIRFWVNASEVGDYTLDNSPTT